MLNIPAGITRVDVSINTTEDTLDEVMDVLDGLREGETIVSGTYQAIRDLKDGTKVKESAETEPAVLCTSVPSERRISWAARPWITRGAPDGAASCDQTLGGMQSAAVKRIPSM